VQLLFQAANATCLAVILIVAAGTSAPAAVACRHLMLLLTPAAAAAAAAARLEEIIADMQRRIEQGEVLYVHCWGGRGRVGLVGACFLAATYK
jgi:protein-tyrosine phosphatase